MFSRRGVSDVALIALACSMLGISGCGGGDDGGGSGPIRPEPTTPTPPSSSTNPCTAVLAQDPGGASGAGAGAGTSALSPSPIDRAKGEGFGSDDRDVREPLWEHYLRGSSGGGIAAATPSASQDIGEIAVLEDDGTLFLRQNAFDLRNLTLRFERNTSGGYDVTRADPTFRQTIGSKVTLTDDDASRQPLPFGFSFYGAQQSSLFVNSDGNLTFEDADTASSTRGFARLLGGPPRIAPFFADLDPSVAGGVYLASSSTAFVVTWCGVRGFESTRSTTVQVTLLPTGVIEMTFGEQIDLAEGIVAVSPGRTGNFSPLDLSASGRQGGGAAAAGERFSETTELDTVAVSRKFYQTHPDNFDQLVMWADTTVVDGGTFAFESTVSNAIRGIGAEVFNASSDFGSAGRLSSLVVMDRLGKYPDDPAALTLGENSTLAVLAHETGHRWLALLRFRDAAGQSSDLLLGRQLAHWNFFFDSDASVMEGNDIEALGGGAFRTTAAAQRYSRLDMYAMGLVTPAEVSTFFYVDSPIDVQPDRNRESAPRNGVTFSGTRRDVLLQDVIDVLGARQPSAAESPRQHRQAFVYVISRGATPGADVQKLDRVRREWPAFFQRATEGRMTVETSLR